MRVFSRIALVVISVAVLVAPAALGQPNVATCPVTLVAQNAPATDFYKSPHGVFRFGSQVFELRGQTLTTYTVTDLGDMQVAREDFIGSMAARESNGAAVFNNGWQPFLNVDVLTGNDDFERTRITLGVRVEL